MKSAAKIIRREIKNQKARFVFPSETVAALWAAKACSLTGERSVAMNRFLAWDRFKETAIRSGLRDREPVSQALRKLFARALARKNARAREAPPSPGAPLPFRALIPPPFAAEGEIFAGELARLLPSLSLLKSRWGSEGSGDDEDRDFLVLEGEYRAFLEKYGLFEPAWEKPPLGDRDHEYYLFFPGVLEDWEEYRELLEGEPSVHVIRGEGEDSPGEDGALRLYHSARTEIREAAREIRRLHEEEGIPYGDMALSVPGLEETESYILRDFALYDIPVRRRAGKPLAEYGAGKLFALAGSCAANNFSFASLKALLLNDQIPWRRPDLNRRLLEFGVTNNCVAGFSEGGRRVDIWAEALRRNGREEELRNYYGELKERILALAEAKSFAGIRRRYFAFRGRLWEPGRPGPEGEARLREAYPGAEHPGSVFQGFLSRDACSPEGDAVLARCVEELSALIRLEEAYPDLVPPLPFGFFLEELREIRYVPLSAGGGVNLFPYRVAAGAPFQVHLVLSASQRDATVLYQPLKFLRMDKRKRLGLTDYDASPEFFRLYSPGTLETAEGPLVIHTRISASERGFSGWAIPHSRFADRLLRMPPPEGDPYGTERDWWAGEAVEFPPRLFAAQKNGFERWRLFLQGGGAERYSFLRAPFSGPAPAKELLAARINRVQREPAGEGGLLKVSATDLNGFFHCPLSWLWGKIFSLEEEALEARLLDDASLGLLYHEILKNLFTRIRETDRLFKAENRETYRRWAEELTLAAAGNYPAFQGPLAVPLLVSMARTMARKIRGLLDLEARYFPGSAVSELEVSLEIRRGKLLLKGRLDRVSLSAEEEPFIVDYKTGGTPSRADSTGRDDGSLGDFQIPLYVKLYEEGRGISVQGAFFISINGQDLAAVLGSPGKKRGHRRDDYGPTLELLESFIGRFAASVEALDFTPGELSFETCRGCAYRGVCRRVYALNADLAGLRPGKEAPPVP